MHENIKNRCVPLNEKKGTKTSEGGIVENTILFAGNEKEMLLSEGPWAVTDPNR